MVNEKDLDNIRAIVECAYADYFGGHETELTLEAGVGYYGHDIVHVVFVFDESPPGLGGRKTVAFKGRVNDEMDEAGLLIDPVFEFHLRSELEEMMAEQANW